MYSPVIDVKENEKQKGSQNVGDCLTGVALGVGLKVSSRAVSAGAAFKLAAESFLGLFISLRIDRLHGEGHMAWEGWHEG